MPVSTNLYNHTTKRFAEGSNSSSDSYRVILCTASTFNAADTTLAGITKTEVANAYGYTTNGQALSNVAVTTYATNDAKFDADDVIWSASGGSITANSAILFNDTDTDDPPVAHIDFGATETAVDGAQFRLVWNADGILTFTTA